MGAYTIRELENLSGIKAHTIRIWEKRYGLITPQRTSGNVRTYCDGELKKLLNISVLNRNGLKISAIARLTQEEIVAKINEMTGEICFDDNQVGCLTEAMIDLDEYRIEQVLAKSIIHFGFEEAAIRIIYPFLKKVGILWQTGNIHPAQEHFISNLIRQKFFVAIDGLMNTSNPHSRCFVFFLPEEELHELALLFLCYLAKKRGHRVLYLGQSVPFEDLVKVVYKKKADYVVTSLTSTLSGKDLEKYINKVAGTFPDQKILVGGPQAVRADHQLLSNVTVLSSPVEFQKQLNSLD